MSSFINSHLIEPVVRQARRFSSTPTEASTHRPTSNIQEQRHANNFAVDGELAGGGIPIYNAHTNLLASQHHLIDQEGDYLGQDTFRADVQMVSETDASQTANARGRDNLPPLLHLDDIRSNLIFETPPVLSPTSELGDLVPSSASYRNTEAMPLPGLSSMSIDDGPRMTRNPSIAISDRLRSHDGASIHSGMSRTSGERLAAGSIDSGLNVLARDEGFRMASPAMSGKLPEDDGMSGLRQQIHQIREMALSAEEKARRMHELMTAEYQAFKMANSEEVHNAMEDGHLHVDPGKSPRTSVSGASLRSASPGTVKSDINDLTVSPEDQRPTFAPRSLDDTEQQQNGSLSDEEEEDRILGCKHYKRNVKIQCTHCRRWYTCRHCHDEVENHTLDRKGIRNMLCMLCGHPQTAAEYCQNCGEVTADYYCGICKLWDNDPRRKIYHCGDCGICRRGEGLGKDYVHCKKCNVCISIAWVATHRCVERATECDCPICGEWMFTSSAAVVAMRCGHYIHRKCYDAYMQTSYKCPICNRSAVNMELQWRKLDRHIEGQPMPSQFAQTKVWVTCNDCAARSCTAFHWLGNKCVLCDSYNTNEVRLVNSPAQHEAEAIENAERERMLEAAEGTRTAPEVVEGADEALHPPLALAAIGPQDSPMEDARGFDDIIHEIHPIASPRPARASVNLTVLEGRLQDPAETSRSPSAGLEHDMHEASKNMAHSVSPNSRVPTSGAEIEMADLGDHATANEHISRDEELEEDDVGFWGEPISPNNWVMPAMPSLPAMPSIPEMPLGMPAMPNSWAMPNMPNMRAMPAMPTMPTMPAMPVSMSPLSSWNSNRFFATRKADRVGEINNINAGEGGEVDEEGEEEEDSDEDMTMYDEGEEEGEEEEEEGNGDEMELFGHR